MSSPDCIFCTPQSDSVFLRGPLAYAFWDGFAVTPLHALVIPNRHAATVFEITGEEMAACLELVQRVRTLILERDPAVTGFNVGTNAGESAGQTIRHADIHTHGGEPDAFVTEPLADAETSGEEVSA